MSASCLGHSYLLYFMACTQYCPWELGQQTKESLKKHLDIFIKGHKLRQEYIKQAQEKKNELQVYLQELKKQEENLLDFLKEKEAEKKEVDFQERVARRRYKRQQDALAKKREAEKQKLLEQQKMEEANARKAFAELDRNGDRILTLRELQTFLAFDYDYDGVVSEKEGKFFLQMKEEITLEDFVASGWKVLKHAYLMAKDSPDEADNDTYDSELAEKFHKWDIKRKEQVSYKSSIEQKQKTPLDKKSVKSIAESAERAKQQFTNLSQTLQKVQLQIREIEQDLDTSFGYEDEYFVLKGQCYDYQRNGYLFKVCPFQYVKQVSLEGFDILLGLWDKWMALNESSFSKVKYENGTRCLRGVDHIASVIHHCGAVNEVLQATEASPCEYQFDFATPAMCASLPSHTLEILGEINLEF